MATKHHLGFCQTGNSAVCSAVPQNPTPRTKHERDRMTRCRVIAICYGNDNYSKLWSIVCLFGWFLKNIIH